ncbi:alanine dehydrogenase [Parachlamydia sp. AcF125]|uniref:alanine dehydrogenase n=1 Tax=Parachlamydia sp. AcF125 TaxID=2795736 RepID=UPI001BC94676|nr:alanine dehydrogenase [Parachlamydia sp. AcF125]MBS4167985.1 Alanine dehydrogenase [Parachlamydia sp. AcF125]
MIIGVPKEIKNHEYRVGLTPANVKILKECGHTILVQEGAGEQVGFSNAHYESAGAKIVSTAAKVFQSELIIKVKEPQESEFSLMHAEQTLFCYLHLAPDPAQTRQLLERKVVAIAYETITDAYGRLPLLVPMSEIAGRIAIQVGAFALQLNNGGKGALLGGVPGVAPAQVVVLGGGVVGTEAARMAMGLGAQVTIIDKDLNRLRQLDALFGPRLITLYSTPATIAESLVKADLAIGAVLIPGKKAPRLVSKEMVANMSPGSVIVDVAIDQGGCFETAVPTTHANPLYEVNGVVHYCVTNMPGACAATSTRALTNATMEYTLELANKGIKAALLENVYLRQGVNLYKGQVTYQPVAQDLGYEYCPLEVCLN